MDAPGLLKNPYVLAGGAALLVLLIVSRSHASASAATTSPDLASQQLATTADVQLASIQAATQQEQDKTNAALAVAQTNASTALTSNLFGGILSMVTNSNNNQAQLSAQSAQIAGGIANNAQTLAAQKTLLPQLAQISASVAVPLAQVQTAGAVQIAGINASSAANIANINASSALNRQLVSSGASVVNSSAGGLGGLLSGVSSLFGF